MKGFDPDQIDAKRQGSIVSPSVALFLLAWFVGQLSFSVPGVGPSVAVAADEDDFQLTAFSHVADGVQCFVVTVAGSETVRRSFDVTPGQDAVFTLKGLPSGGVTFTADAFDSACASVTPDTIATWTSEPVPATVTRGVVDQVKLVLHRNGQTIVKAEFADDKGGAPVTPVAGGGRTECVAQRTVHIVAGNGGLAWFSLVWPVPEVISGYEATYAYDDPAKAALVPGTTGGRLLYARKIAGRTLWDGIGTHGAPTVFVAGTNQTHTNSPQTTRLAGGTEVVAAGAALQSGLAAPLPVLSVGNLSSYGSAPGAPKVAMLANIEGAVEAVRSVTPLSFAVEQDLRPAPAKLATWTDPNGPAALVNFAKALLFTANAFRLGLISTVLLPAFNDDPHGAFAGGNAMVTARADALARILDSFYAELATNVEPKCGHAGKALSLADNVVLIVSGDTPKNSFQRSGWPDGTVGNSNLLYVRSNGYLKPGWFGGLSPTTRTNFDPTTGAAKSGAGPDPDSTAAAQLGILFAIARGDAASVARASAAPYVGVIETPLP